MYECVRDVRGCYVLQLHMTHCLEPRPSIVKQEVMWFECCCCVVLCLCRRPRYVGWTDPKAVALCQDECGERTDLSQAVHSAATAALPLSGVLAR